MAASRVSLVHISPVPIASFVKRDIEILQSRYEVRPLRYRGWNDLLHLTYAVATSDAVVSWFAWDHAFWANRVARVLQKGTVTIAGGFDVVSLPELGYGNLSHTKGMKLTRSALRSAGAVLAVSRSIAENAATLTGRSDIRVVYHGFDADLYPYGSTKSDFALTVGEVTRSNLVRKGILTFIRAAALMPEVPFILAGRLHSDALGDISNLPSNLRIQGWVSDRELRQLMQDAAVYVQVSAHEGFGCSLAEAMLCGDIPVVTGRGAIPEVVGDTGIYVPVDDPQATADGIREALSRDSSAHAAARNRVSRLFPIHRRREALLRAVADVLR